MGDDPCYLPILDFMWYKSVIWRESSEDGTHYTRELISKTKLLIIALQQAHPMRGSYLNKKVILEQILTNHRIYLYLMTHNLLLAFPRSEKCKMSG